MAKTTLVSQERRIYCRNEGCNVEITFDSRKSKSGKSIPIEVGSGLPHSCKFSPWALRQQQESNVENRINEAKSTGIGQISRINGVVTITELESRITDILERCIVLESAFKEYKEQIAK